MDVIGSSAFSCKLDTKPENQFAKNAKEAFSHTTNIRFKLSLIIPGLLKKLGIRIFAPENMDFFKNLTLEIIRERRKTGQTRNDFLQLLIDATTEGTKEDKKEEMDDLSSNYINEAKFDAVSEIATTKRMTMDDLVAQSLVFFLAGYHTTVTTLGLATYLLALHQDVQEKVFKEISEVVKETEGDLKYESIQKMKYLDNVVSEVFRLYPPNIRLERTTDADYKLGETGLIIPKGMLVGIPIFAMHRDPKFFPNPENFDPDRFSSEEREKQTPYSYLPFGAGPRNCVGMRFALLELKVCLVYVFSVFRVKIYSKTQVPLEFGQGGGFLSPKSIDLVMEPRTDVPLNL